MGNPGRLLMPAGVILIVAGGVMLVVSRLSGIQGRRLPGDVV